MYKVAYLTKNRMVKVVDVKVTRVVGFSHTVEIEESFFFLGVIELNTSNVYFPNNGYTDFELFISSFPEFIPVIQDNHFSEKERLLNFNPVDLFLVKKSQSSTNEGRQTEEPQEEQAQLPLTFRDSDSNAVITNTVTIFDSQEENMINITHTLMNSVYDLQPHIDEGELAGALQITADSYSGLLITYADFISQVEENASIQLDALEEEVEPSFNGMISILNSKGCFPANTEVQISYGSEGLVIFYTDLNSQIDISNTMQLSSRMLKLSIESYSSINIQYDDLVANPSQTFQTF